MPGSDYETLARVMARARAQLASQPQRIPTTYGAPQADSRAMAPETFDVTRTRQGFAEGGAPGNDYNTALSPSDERAFQLWKQTNAPNDSGVDYDLRGAYLANMQRSPDNGHMGDRFKKPNHPTFSDQSQYAVGDQRDRAGFWAGPEGADQTFVPPSFAEGGVPDDKPAFDPTKPFEPVAADSAAKPAFDPSKPFEPATAPTAPEKLPQAPPVAGDIGSAMPEAYGDPNAGLGASLVKAAKSVPASALQFARNTVQPFIHPGDTATSLKNLGLGVLEKTGLTSGHDHEQYADAVGKFLAERYGGLDRAQKTFETDPVGMAGDLSMILSGGGSAAARLPGLFGKAGEIAGAAGRAIDPMTPALAAANSVAKGAGRVGTEIAGVTTGTGGEALKVAGESGFEGGHAGRLFRENLRGNAPLQDAVGDARGAVAQLRHERGNDYLSGMGQVKADPTVLDFAKIDQAVANAQGIKSYAGRSGSGPAQSLNPKTQGIRQEMTDAIEHWKTLDPAEFHSPEGIDALKQQLGDIRDATQPNTPDRVAADKIYNAVRQTIVDQVPEYAKVMKGYEQASNQIKEIEATLSLNPKASVDTALRKLQSTLRDNVNTSFGRRAELAQFLTRAGAPHLMEKLAGQTLHSWTPRGLGRFVAAADLPAMGAAVAAGHPLVALGAAAGLPLMSPRLMGEAAHGIGRAAGYASPALSALARPARQAGQLTGPLTPAAPGNPYAP